MTTAELTRRDVLELPSLVVYFALDEMARSEGPRRRLCAEVVERRKGRAPEQIEVELLVRLFEPMLARLLIALSRVKDLTEERDDMFVYDALAAELLESLEDEGRARADRLRVDSRERWRTSNDILRLWCDSEDSVSQVRFLRLLADTIWLTQAGPQLRYAKTPSLTLPVTRNAAALHFGPGRSVTQLGERMLVESAARLVVGRVVPSPRVPPEVLVTTCMDSSISLTAHRFLRWLIHQGYRRKLLHELPAIDVVGGVAGLAARLGLRSKKESQRLVQVLEWFQHAHVALPDGQFHGLLIWEELGKAAPGRQRLLRIVPGSLLAPDFYWTFPKGSVGRKLVPIPESLPPLVGRRNERAAQALLQLLVLLDLRMKAAHLWTAGSAEISEQQWRALADEAGVAQRLLPAVRDAWLQGAEPAPAFLSEPTPGRWTLATPYARELDSLLEAGKQETGGREAGKQSVARRRKETDRNAPPSGGTFPLL